MPQLPLLSVVGPVFNERDNLSQLLAEIHEGLTGASLDGCSLGEQASGAAHGGYEIVLVDDCSDDGSLDVMLREQQQDPRLRVLRLPRRCGQSAALAAGLRAARAETIATLDTDLQNDPRDFPLLVRELARYDLVCGVRGARRDGWSKRAASRVANRVRRWAIGDQLSDIGCGMRVGRARFVCGLPPFNGLHRFLPVLAARRGASVGEVLISHRPRRFGVSKYGVADRLFRGIYDLVGVAWLQRRWVEVEAVEIAAGVKRER
jgi:glycosyltransferase involved in cell wall biosynthesis